MGNSISHLVDRVMEVPDVTGTLRLKSYVTLLPVKLLWLVQRHQQPARVQALEPGA